AFGYDRKMQLQFSVLICTLICSTAILAAASESGKRHQPVQKCSPDRPLGGWLRVDIHWKDRIESGQIETKALLRFPLIPTVSEKISPWPFSLHVLTAPEVTYEVASDGGSFTIENGNEKCDVAPGRISGTVSLGRITNLGFQSTGETITLYPMDPSLNLSTLPDQISKSLNLDETCVTYGGGKITGTFSANFKGLAIFAQN